LKQNANYAKEGIVDPTTKLVKDTTLNLGSGLLPLLSSLALLIPGFIWAIICLGLVILVSVLILPWILSITVGVVFGQEFVWIAYVLVVLALLGICAKYRMMLFGFLTDKLSFATSLPGKIKSS